MMNLHYSNNDIISLNVYTLAAANALSYAIDEVGRPHIIPDPISYEKIDGFPRFCFIKPNGEFFVIKKKIDDFETYSLGRSFLKHVVLTYLDFMHAMNAFSDDIVKNYLKPEFVKSQIFILEAVLRWWDRKATQDDIRIVGTALNPFQENEFKAMLEEAERLDKIRDYHQTASHYPEGLNSEINLKKHLTKIAMKICECQNRPEDMKLFDW